MEEPQKPSTKELMEANKLAARATVKRILLAAGIGLIVGLVMTWWESRQANPEID